jgi:hypothetical protein
MLGPVMGGVQRSGGGRAAAVNRGVTDPKGPAAQDNPRVVVTGVAARIRELAGLRDEGGMTEEEFTDQKSRLLGR